MKSEPLGAGTERKYFLRADQLIVLCTRVGEILLRGFGEGEERRPGWGCLQKEIMTRGGIKTENRTCALWPLRHGLFVCYMESIWLVLLAYFSQIARLRHFRNVAACSDFRWRCRSQPGVYRVADILPLKYLQATVAELQLWSCSKMISWLGVATMPRTILKGRSFRKVENRTALECWHHAWLVLGMALLGYFTCHRAGVCVSSSL